MSVDVVRAGCVVIRAEIDEHGRVKRPITGPATIPSLRVVFEPGPDGVQTVTLDGSIDENADLPALFSKLAGDVVFNMRQVERVNSIGVHRWIPLVTSYAAQHRVFIDDISYALVQNANVVANLFGAATVRSAMAPYFCSRCKENVTERVTHQEVAERGYAPPAKTCTTCSSPMEFDELDGYFGFFKPRPRR